MKCKECNKYVGFFEWLFNSKMHSDCDFFNGFKRFKEAFNRITEVKNGKDN